MNILSQEKKIEITTERCLVAFSEVSLFKLFVSCLLALDAWSLPDLHFTISKSILLSQVTPVFFNIGINEKATLAETLGYTKEQHRSNWDNYDRLKQYHARYKHIPFNFVNPSCSAALDTPTKTGLASTQQKEVLVPEHAVASLFGEMEEQLRANSSKNYRILTLAEDITRSMQGLRFTSCKSAKDRTSMGVTLEQCRVLQQEFHLSSSNAQNVLDTMRR